MLKEKLTWSKEPSVFGMLEEQRALCPGSGRDLVWGVFDVAPLMTVRVPWIRRHTCPRVRRGARRLGPTDTPLRAAGHGTTLPPLRGHGSALACVRPMACAFCSHRTRGPDGGLGSTCGPAPSREDTFIPVRAPSTVWAPTLHPCSW